MIESNVIEVRDMIKEFLKREFNIDIIPPIFMNGRLGRRVLGRYYPKSNRIEIAKKFRNENVYISTVLHEAVHYALNYKEEAFKDGTLNFETTLSKYNIESNYYGDDLAKKNGLENWAEYNKAKNENMVLDYIKYFREKNVDTIKEKEVVACKIDKGVKLEKTKISSLLHEYKTHVFMRGSNEWGFLTDIIDAIDKTKATDRQAIIKIYKDLIDGVEINVEKYEKLTRLQDIIELVKTKVEA